MLHNKSIKTIFILVSILIVHHCSFAQQYSLPGLYESNLSNQFTGAAHDTNELHHLIVKYGWELSEKAPDSAMRLLQEALKASEQLNYQQGIRSSLYFIGDVYAMQGRYKDAIEYFYQSANAAERYSDYGITWLSYWRLSSIFTDLRQYDKAFFI